MNDMWTPADPPRPPRRRVVDRAGGRCMTPAYRYTLERDIAPDPHDVGSLTRSLLGGLFPGLRVLGGAPRRLLWVMCNPSTADEAMDDPTIRRCIGFSAQRPPTKMVVVNLFAARATNPKALRAMADPAGPLNNQVIADEIRLADDVVVAWGNAPSRWAVGRLRIRIVAGQLLSIRTGACLWALGFTAAGHPRHPLYLPRDTRLMSAVDYLSQAWALRTHGAAR